MAFAMLLTVDNIAAERISRNMGMVKGTIDYTSYDSPVSEASTGIQDTVTTTETKLKDYFKDGTCRVILGSGISSNGFGVGIDETYPTNIKAWDTLTDGSPSEATDDDDIGTIPFIAVGLI